MSSETKLTRNENGESIDDTKYRGMIGSLLYLTASRSDIMFNVCLCAVFKNTKIHSHLEAVKRIFRYIKGTSHLGLWYPKGTGLETIIYVDSDHARDYVDHKSTSGVCTIMGCCLTSWFSKKQTALAISTTKAEYVSAGKACQQALWMKQALVDYDIKLDDIPVLCDNKGAINLNSTTTKATDPLIRPYPFTGERARKPAKTLPRGSLLSPTPLLWTIDARKEVPNAGEAPIYTRITISPTSNNDNLLLTPKSTPPPLTSPPPAPTQPSKLTSPLAINLDPIELLFSTPPTSPQAFLDSIEDLPPATTNPPPPHPSFDTIERLANEPPPTPPINSSFPSPTSDRV
ncbi:hypothetical protein Tco_1375837 [Tanacetum coccineum]